MSWTLIIACGYTDLEAGSLKLETARSFLFGVCFNVHLNLGSC